ncbi:hypothetical protein [Paenibacillus soyae]|uniref:Uncharacterized protein n=1 Tax=Paenibacillus soyae TaxID=2969249 RepID=A0A9X2MKW1_9BACL|nr:hypothetical protein [Paenibacillus soyae]MCR2803818.1 hypothetical protein [Paenibacillus soyae]
MKKKHCLFCNELAALETDDDGFDTYSDCMCAPGAFYRLDSSAYSAIQALPYAKKRTLLPVVSAYIREQFEEGDRAALTLDRILAIADSPDVPMTQEEKEKRLLRYLYRRSDAPLEPMSLHPMSRHYNVAYAANLQEFVFIMEQLRESGRIIREGAVLRLTEQGWSEAAAIAGGGKRKLCTVMAGDEQIGMELSYSLLAGLEQCGYQTRLLLPSAMKKPDADLLEELKSSKLIVADLSDAGPVLYYSAGYAASAGIPTIWTIHSDKSNSLQEQSGWIRPIVWDKPEELVYTLQQKF